MPLISFVNTKKPAPNGIGTSLLAIPPYFRTKKKVAALDQRTIVRVPL
jgi:hypothetical protein